jgi:hypothetical protein
MLEIRMPDLTGAGSDPTAVRKAMDSPRELFSLFLDRFGWDDAGRRETAFGFFEEARKRADRASREAVQ